MTVEDPTAVTTVQRDWLADEDATPGVWRELKRLGRRARRRWLRAFAYALVCGALVVGAAARRPRSFASRVAFRVTEGSLEAATTPHTNGKLRDYVATVVFSNAHLLSIIKEHNLYPTILARDPGLAIEMMRDDLDVEVWRNYFALARSADDPARSARLAVTFHGKDAKSVYDTVTELGRLISESEQRSRVLQAEAGLRLADDQVESTRTLLGSRKRALVDKQVALEHARTPEQGLQFLVEERDLERELPRAEKLLETAERRREQLYMRAQLERHALGLRWELIDPGRIEPLGMSRRTLLGWLGAIAFVFALPLCAVGVGAFDPRVYDLDDVRRLGMAAVGAVRGFDGDNAGALVARLGDEARARIGPS
jgi:hypothetical protein